MHYNFFISDTHLGHNNIITFKDSEGNIVRPFKTIEEHDELIIQNWNKVVRKVDKVYHLGDVVMNRRCLITLERLNGRKVLIKGNHDIFNLKDYTKYFEDIVSMKVFPNLGFIFTHVPIHPIELGGRFKYNFHGHLHQNLVKSLCIHHNIFAEIIDKRYINLCVEHINYTPIELDDLILKYKGEL